MMREISPVFSLSGQNVPPSRHVESMRASITGELGIRTANLCPAQKPDDLRESVILSARVMKSLREIQLCANQQQLLSGREVR